MPTTDKDLEKIRKQREKQSELVSEASDYSATAGGLQETIMDAVRQDRAQRGISQLSKDVGATMGQMATDAPQIRQRTGDMVNPMEVDVLTAQQRGQNLRTLGTLATQKEQTQGNIIDTISANADRLKAIASQKLAEAKQASTEADNMMDELYYQLDVRKQEFAEDKAAGAYDTGGGGGGVWSNFYDDMYGLMDKGREGEDLVTALMDIYPELTEEEIRDRTGAQSQSSLAESEAEKARATWERGQPGFFTKLITQPGKTISDMYTDPLSSIIGKTRSAQKQLRARQKRNKNQRSW